MKNILLIGLGRFVLLFSYRPVRRIRYSQAYYTDSPEYGCIPFPSGILPVPWSLLLPLYIPLQDLCTSQPDVLESFCWLYSCLYYKPYSDPA